MPRTTSLGIQTPTATDMHPSEQWWSNLGSTTTAAITREIGSLEALVRREYVPRTEAEQYGIPGPPNSLRIGSVTSGVVPFARVMGDAPDQTLDLSLPLGPRGPEGPGGAFQMRETAEAGLFEVSDVQNSTVTAAVVTAMAGAQISRGIVPAGANLDTYRTANHSGVWELAASRSYVNSPIASTEGGLLVVQVQRAMAYQRVIRHAVPGTFERSAISSGVFYPWTGVITAQPTGVSLDDLRVSQDVLIRNTTDANTITGGWPPGLPRTAAAITVRVTSTGLVFQHMQTYGADPRFLIRSTASTSPSPYPFSSWKDLTAPSSLPPAQSGSAADAGLANSLLVQDFTRRRPVVKTSGLPAVALRFDHGLGPFRDKVIPALKRLGLKGAQALNGGDWDRAENGGVTASQVNTWVSEGWLEVWNHSLNHIAPPASQAELETQIKGGLDKLRADLPAAVIDGYAPPGSSGDTTGFEGGGSITSWWNTAPGRAILKHHAVGAGYLDGTVYRTLDGQVRQGQSHYTVDTLDLAAMKDRVTGAYADARGVALMLHPSRLDTEGYLDTAAYVAFLEWLAAERDAGRLVVVGYYDLLRADSSVETPAGSVVDVPERDITPAVATEGALRVSRYGPVVTAHFDGLVMPPDETSFTQLNDVFPAGFHPTHFVDHLSAPRASSDHADTIRIDPYGGVVFYDHTGGAVYGLVTWRTDDPAP